MTDRNQILERNKLHLVCDEVAPIPDGVEGYEAALVAAGVKVLDIQEFGSYQGRWWAQIEFPNGQVFYVTDYYGSCSYCDAFMCEFDWGAHKKPDYLHRLKDFGRNYLEECFTLDEAISKASENLTWDYDAEEMVEWLEAKRP